MSTENLAVIVGLGATGVSCARHLKKHGVAFAVMDTRLVPPHLDAFQKDFPDVPLSLGGFDANLLNQATTIILSPGIALREPAIAAQIAKGKRVIGDIELFAEAVTAPVIAITGTNAKSTVTTLVGKMAEAAGYRVQVGGNLGIPALDLLETDPAANLFVLELSSFQLETTYSLKSRVATVLNVSPDHMDRYETLEDYRQAKLRIYQHCQIAVCNKDDPRTDCHATHLQHKYYFTTGTPGNDEFGLLATPQGLQLAFGNQALLPVSALPVAGKHYQANCLAALAMGHGFGLPMDVMLQVLREFKGLSHRCQLVRERSGVKWYNDSKGTNIGATQAAIEGLGSGLEGKLVLIAGGVGKNADFKPLAPLMKEYARHAVLIGEAAHDIEHAIKDVVPVSFATTMEEAVLLAAQVAKPQDCVLLSPACASFDMFNHYAHRGDVFMDIVNKLV